MPDLSVKPVPVFRYGFAFLLPFYFSKIIDFSVAL